MSELELSENINLKKEIIAVLIRFDIFNQPLTAFEFYKFLGIKSDYSFLLQALAELKTEGKISFLFGFYCLPGRSEIIKERFKRLNYFNFKIKKAKSFTRLIAPFPFIKGVFVSNIIGDHNLRQGSDIDFLIITSPHRLWLARLICVFWAKILGLRPNKKTKKDKICLSFYISSDNLSLEKYLYNQDDFYFVYWLAGLEPIFFRQLSFSEFWQNNLWLKKYLPNFTFPFCCEDERVATRSKNKKNYFSAFYKKLDNLLKRWQIRIMPAKLKNLYQVSTGVLLEDNIIKLFLEDKRLDFIEEFKKRSQSL